MLKVLLVIDDPSQLSHLQDQLEGAGFDVQGIQHSQKPPENFQVAIVGTTQVNEISSLSKRGVKIIWLRNKGDAIHPKVTSVYGVNRVLISPVTVGEWVQVISELSDPKVLLENGTKSLEENEVMVIRGESSSDKQIVIVKGHSREKPPSEVFSHVVSNRSDRYKAFLEAQDPLKKKYFSRENIAHFTQEIRDQWDEELEARLKEERRKVVEILFNKVR